MQTNEIFGATASLGICLWTLISVCLFFSTLREEHWVDFDAGPVPQPLGQLGEVEALQAEADLQVLAAAFHLVRHWHVCRSKGEREREVGVRSRAL